MPRYAHRPRRLITLACAGILTILSACGGGGGSSSTSPVSTCGETARKQWVLDTTRAWYLFQDTLPATVDLGAYATAEELLDALTAEARAQGKDRYFSYLTTPAAENSLLGEGEYVGFGFRNRTDNGNQPYILDVYEGSPAADAGLQRGDEIVAVDEGSGFVPVTESLVGGRTISDLLGPADAGVRRGLRLSFQGALREVYLTKRTVTIDPVPSFGVAVLPLAGTTGVGYLHLRSYISTADPQLRDAFVYLRGQNLQYFIVDLRYNGGGIVSTSELLDNLLGADRSSADVQYRMIHNAAKASQDATVRFQPQAQSVAPVRIAFLTTDATASASELTINAIKPWVIETAIVGSDTLGKPVGQLAFDLGGCQDRLRLISFKLENAAGESDYYQGLAANMRYACAAQDTLDAPLGSADDNLTRAALGWMSTGACATPMTAGFDARAKPSPAFVSPYPRPLRPTDAEHWLPGVN
ncbi:MAG TPA: S41 family peptidase [Steroidobacteraceae bacterium]